MNCFKNLYSIGDSFMFGMECLGDRNRSQENKNHAFASHLSNLLECDYYYNNSYNGSTNEFIFRRCMLDLMHLESEKNINPEETFVLIGITSLHRIEIDGDRWFEQIPNTEQALENLKDSPDFPIEYDHFGTLFINPGSGVKFILPGLKEFDTGKDVIPWCTQFIWTEPVQLPVQEARIIALHNFLSNRGYKHLFVNTVCPLENTTIIDKNCKNFYKIDQDCFYNFSLSNFSQELREMNHFSEKPHIEYAKQIHEYLKEIL